ncbi:MAG TPA: DinB family protein [Thermoanaerobaculia bacterium]|nr:DinB family protein [Thermoanaerobaculia bacterium]
MKEVLRWIALLAAAAALASAPAAAETILDLTPSDPPAPAAPTPAVPAPSAPAAGFRGEYLRNLAELEEKLVALAGATPAELYRWRPGEGVRSIGEVYAHVVASNTLLPRSWGAPPLDGVDPAALQQSPPEKAQLVALLERSIEHVRKAFEDASPVDLERRVPAFGREATVRELFSTLVNHMHEHLGQSIAYARLKGVVPPWSAGAAAEH